MTGRILALAAVAATATAKLPESPLRLDEVLRSVESSYPLLLAAIQERAAAEGKELSTQGAFDTGLSVESAMNQLGFYKNRTNGIGIEQPLRNWGGEIFGGYSRGQGNFGPWEEDLLTLSGGEFSGGARLPLFRNREIDERRTDLLLARLSIELAGASIERQRLKFFETAAKFYWDWVAAGQKARRCGGIAATGRRAHPPSRGVRRSRSGRSHRDHGQPPRRLRASLRCRRGRPGAAERRVRAVFVLPWHRRPTSGRAARAAARVP